MDRAHLARANNRRIAFRPWLGGLIAACVVLGPALRPGDLLNLDLVTTPRLRAPDWRWGVGPGVPHRVPMYIPLSWISHLITGATIIKVLCVVMLTLLFAGVWRLAASGDARVDAGVALFVTWSPFTVTRVAVGHLGVLWAMVAVAWGAPMLLRLDAASSRATRRLTGVAAFGGLIPGSWILAVGAAGVIGGPRNERRARARQWLALLPLHLIWIVPSALFALLGPRLVGSEHFRPSIGVLAPLEFFAGLGFWREPNQVLAPPWWPIIALLVAGLAVLGLRPTRALFGRPWILITGSAIVVPIVAVVPPFSIAMSWLTGSAIGAPLREIQRWWGLALVLLAPCLAAGALTLADRLSSILPLVLPSASALLLAGNGLWGVGGALKTIDYPVGWYTTASFIRHQAGTTLVLPWHQYMDVSFADGRRTLNPLADFLPGDIVFSTDPELTAAQGEVDPRGGPAVKALDDPGTASTILAGLGIRYIAAAHFDSSDERVDRLALTAGFTSVYTDADITLLRVEKTATRSVDWGFGPVGRVSKGDAPLALAGGSGWVLDGQLISGTTAVLDPGNREGFLWYWPALAILFADGVSLVWWARAAFPRGRQSTSSSTSAEE